MTPKFKEIENKKTEAKYPTKDVPVIDGYDYITVTGARTRPWVVNKKQSWNPLSGHMLKASWGNQYHFVNQSLRQLQQFPKPDLTNYRVQRIHVVFSKGYSSNDRERINEYTETHHARIKYVKNVAQLIAFLNERKSKNRLIKKLTIYSHGIIDFFSFHYGDGIVADETPGLLGKSQIPQILEEVFDFDAVLESYACRTGISIDSEDFSEQKGEAGQENSLAQIMADAWLINVKAYESRSDYALTYGTKSEIDKAKNYQETIKKYEDQKEIYKQALASGEKADKPEEPIDHQMWIIRMNDEKLRNENQRWWDDGPIMQYGAWHPVQGGTSPKGLKKGLQTYIPKDYQ